MADGKHTDIRFPKAEDNYACNSCKKGDHLHCSPTVYLIGYDFKCECNQAAPEAHEQLRFEEKQMKVADILADHQGWPSERYVGKFTATEHIYYVTCCDCGWEDIEAEEAKLGFTDEANHRMHQAAEIVKGMRL